MFRTGTEWLLGIRKAGDSLVIDPCIPRHWRGFEVRYKHGTASYEIRVENPAGVSRGVGRIELDGQIFETVSIPLVDDGQTHLIVVTLGPE